MAGTICQKNAIVALQSAALFLFSIITGNKKGGYVFKDGNL
jgi:hypothetical protein